MNDQPISSPELAKANFEQLLELLKDKDPEVRRRAVIDLKDLGDRRAAPFLIEKLKDKSSHVQGTAVRALQELDDERAVGPLIAILQNKKEKTSVRMVA